MYIFVQSGQYYTSTRDIALDMGMIGKSIEVLGQLPDTLFYLLCLPCLIRFGSWVCGPVFANNPHSSGRGLKKEMLRRESGSLYTSVESKSLVSSVLSSSTRLQCLFIM
jgi:hypothetical protein